MRDPDAVPVLVDCDTGVDDALALLYLLAHPAVEIVGITSVFGNADVVTCAHNSARVLALAGRDDVPVAIGAAGPLVGSAHESAFHIHGVDGLGDTGLLADAAAEPVARLMTDETAIELIDRLSAAHAGRLRILALGALTNLARALAAVDGLTDRVVDVVAMGGAADAPGNATAAAEANIHCDPEAAAVVLAADWPVTLVPLDVTMTELLDETQRERLEEADAVTARFAAGAVRGYLDHYGTRYGRRVAAMHDPLAAAIVTGEVVPTLAPALDVVVDTTDGPGRGQTIVDTRGKYGDYLDAAGAVHVVLGTPGGFSEQLVARLIG